MAIKDGVKTAYDGALWYYISVLDLAAFQPHKDPQHETEYSKEPEYLTSHWEVTTAFHEAMFFTDIEDAKQTARDHLDLSKVRAVIRSVIVKVNPFHIGDIVE